eukprot:4916919-Pyramimonas_sp.AAC.1
MDLVNACVSLARAWSCLLLRVCCASGHGLVYLRVRYRLFSRGFASTRGQSALLFSWAQRAGGSLCATSNCSGGRSPAALVSARGCGSSPESRLPGRRHRHAGLYLCKPTLVRLRAPPACAEKTPRLPRPSRRPEGVPRRPFGLEHGRESLVEVHAGASGGPSSKPLEQAKERMISL